MLKNAKYADVLKWDMSFFPERVFLKKFPLIAKGPGPGPGPAGLTRGPGPGPGPAFTHSSTRLLDIYPMTRHLSNDKTFIQ